MHDCSPTSPEQTTILHVIEGKTNRGVKLSRHGQRGDENVKDGRYRVVNAHVRPTTCILMTGPQLRGRACEVGVCLWGGWG